MKNEQDPQSPAIPPLPPATGSAHWPQDGDIYERKTEYWRLRRVVVGMNGSGCPWLKEHWIWPNGETCRTDVLTLTYEQTLKMLEEYRWVNAPNDKLRDGAPETPASQINATAPFSGAHG